jgi:hypothetical protein
MPMLDLRLDGDGAFEDEARKFRENYHFVEDTQLKIARLSRGTVGGKSTVCIGFQLGEQYFAVQTTLALLDSAVQAMKTRDEMEEGI